MSLFVKYDDGKMQRDKMQRDKMPNTGETTSYWVVREGFSKKLTSKTPKRNKTHVNTIQETAKSPR